MAMVLQIDAMAMPEGAMRLHSAMAIATTPMGIQKPKLTFPDDFELRWASFQCSDVVSGVEMRKLHRKRP